MHTVVKKVTVLFTPSYIRGLVFNSFCIAILNTLKLTFGQITVELFYLFRVGYHLLANEINQAKKFNSYFFIVI